MYWLSSIEGTARKSQRHASRSARRGAIGGTGSRGRTRGVSSESAGRREERAEQLPAALRTAQRPPAILRRNFQHLVAQREEGLEGKNRSNKVQVQ